jgi:tetratricopeptide (TPR) repeat protein
MNRSSTAIPRRYDVALICLLLALLLAGCAGAPMEEKPPPPEPASTMLEELLSKQAQNIKALRLLASIYAAMGRREESAEIWRTVAAIDPTDPEATYEVGMSLARNEDWQGLRSQMLAAERNGAADSRHYLLMGEADLELGYKGEAEKYLLKATSEERAVYLLGRLYYEQGRLDDAEGMFKEVLRRNPDNYSSHLHLGWLYFSRNDKRRALEQYRRAVELNPGDPLAALSLAALLEEMDRYEEAISRYRDGLALPGIPPSEKRKAYNSLSRLLVERGRLGEAVSVVERGLAEFPDAGGLHYQWGEVLLQQGRKAEAIERFKRAANDPVWKEVALKKLYAIQ